MDRERIIQAVEAETFEIFTEGPLSCNEQYALARPVALETEAPFTYPIVGSRGGQAVVRSSFVPAEPFLLIRGDICREGWCYRAIGISQLDSIRDRLLIHPSYLTV
jgi:hypothetical protein